MWPEILKGLLMEMMAKEEPAAWEAMMGGSLAQGTLGPDKDTLTLINAQRIDDMKLFQENAKAMLLGSEVQIIIMGHTHLPDQLEVEGGKRYFNPGSWTRYADVSTQENLRMDDLRDESRFPYQLNYIKVELHGTGVLGTFNTYGELQRP